MTGVIVQRGHLLQKRSHSAGAGDPQGRLCRGAAPAAPGTALAFLQRTLSGNRREAHDKHLEGDRREPSLVLTTNSPRA